MSLGFIPVSPASSIVFKILSITLPAYILLILAKLGPALKLLPLSSSRLDSFVDVFAEASTIDAANFSLFTAIVA
jgi:ABC-type sulfate transport system permease component